MTKKKSKFSSETTASDLQMDFRQQLALSFEQSPLDTEDKLFNLGLYVRSALLTKFLVMNDLYKRVKNAPGILVEFGIWYGQNLVLLENLRAIHEPFNKQRKIVGFDTFEGYRGFSNNDKKSQIFDPNSYSTGKDYKKYLRDLLEIHEGNNAFGHTRNVHELVEGNVINTVPAYFEKNQQDLVAFAYFDMGLYEPTKKCLDVIMDRLVPGSVILFDELCWKEAPGETIAFREVFAGKKYKLEKCELFPSKSILTVL